jgi:FixJ family two-component response regulator/signal transduction histidine kinase
MAMQRIDRRQPTVGSAAPRRVHPPSRRARPAASDLFSVAGIGIAAQAIIDAIPRPLLVLDDAMHVVSAGRAFYRFFNASPTDTVGRTLPDSDARHLDVPVLRAFLDRVQAGGADADSCEIDIDLPPFGNRVLIARAEGIVDAGGGSRRILLTFTDVTDYRHSERRLAAAQQAAERANLAKSCFLAAVSHDLRQPLQTMTFLLEMLRAQATGEKAAVLLGRAEETLDSMSGMLDALLDINQLESGTIHPQPIDFPIDDLLGRLDSEYGLHARAHGLGWRVVRSRLRAHSDPRLLEQMLRNLLSNAIRYTKEGRVLLGCRRRSGRLHIEVWDTGIGIAEEELPRVFDEHHRVAGHAGGGGLGLGLAIVQRLGELLDHPIGARSRLGKGSVFAIDLPPARAVPAQTRVPGLPADGGGAERRGAIPVIEDDPAVRDMLQLTLARQEHRTPSAPTGNAAPATIFIVDDDRGVRNSMREFLTTAGYRVETFASGEALLAADCASTRGCLVIDVRMPGMSGFELLARLAAAGNPLPAVLITGHGDVTMAVEAMRAGAADFIEKPVRAEQLLAAIAGALRHAAAPADRSSWRAAAALRIAGLTRREREVMGLVVAGHANKEIAARLAVAQRTVETHRAKAMKKMGASSLSDLVRLALAAAGVDPR